jgi:purine-nucleoside phosphorylase
MDDRLHLLSRPWRHEVAAAVDWLRDRGFQGKVGFVLGSGLGTFVRDGVEPVCTARFEEIPGFHATSVAMHTGRLVSGEAGGVPVLVLQGRLHPYEGLPATSLLLPVAVLACLGVEVALVTNAAGGLRRFHQPGDLMVIRDHLDLHFGDSLRGLLAHPFRPAGGAIPAQEARLVELGRPVSISPLYETRLAELLVEAASARGIPISQGIYASMSGPAFETRSEIGMLRRLGCDVVGMSTAPEAVLLRNLGVKLAGLSCITNPAWESDQPLLSHQGVVEVAEKVRDNLAGLLQEFLSRLGAL